MVFRVSVSAHSNTSACLNSETDAAEHETAKHDDGYEGLLDEVLLKRTKEDDGYEGLGLKRANRDDDGEGADETH